ncbi:hypothetical protein BKA63DRAFT_583789 [Paraphoma chrysanthemicola]|nr:hypothetical protein BKA63DRAFT_583789 [Paraphoma chrysanthemicola]
MSVATIDQLVASFERPLKYLDNGPTNAEIGLADSIARNNLDTAFHLVPGSMVRKPNIDCLYFDQQYTVIPTVPVDLQLTWFLENYTKRGIRTNLIAMAYLMAKDFPKDICNSETERFILAFVEAWISDLVDTGALMTQSFTAREASSTSGLKTRLTLFNSHRFTDQPETIIEMRRNYTISDGEFKKYGSAMVLNHILSMSELSNQNRLEREIKAAKFDRDMDKEVERVQTRMGGDLRRRVDWASRMVDALLGAVDPNMPHPSVIRRQRRQPLREAWLDKPTFFEVLESGLVAVKEEVDDMVDTFGCLW